MRIALFTVNDVDFVLRLLDPLLRQRGHQVVGAYLSNAILDWKRLRRRAGFFIRNRYPFCISTGDWLRFSNALVRSRLKGVHGHRNISDYLASYGISSRRVRDINAPESLDYFKSLNADLFLFAPFGQIAQPPFLNIPRLGVYNVHLGKIPEHKGALSAFWVLRFGHELAGASIHKCASKVDEGDIVEEIRLPVASTRSMKELMFRTVDATAPALVRAVGRIEAGGWTPVDTFGRETGYFFYPARSDFAEFYRRKCRLI
jgi:folate-dependent phosphoribosylglycinamide formyltransferase PurN